MRLNLWSVVGMLARLSAPAGLALADSGPHGGYTATTDACAGCHRAHTAAAARLLVNAVPALCYSCHGTSATGADTNVVDGIYAGLDALTEVPAEGVDNRGLKGGGLVNALMDTDWDGSAAPAPVTSSHLANGGIGTAWGNGAFGSGVGGLIPLVCVSCHDPHGGGGTGGVGTYRLLRATPVNSGASSGVDVADEAAKVYTISDNTRKSGDKYFGEGYDYSNNTSTMDVQESQVSLWCTQCHTRYQAVTGAGHDPSGDAIFAYRHMSRGSAGDCTTTCHKMHGPLIPPHGPMWNHRVECMTCHVAHGTSAHMNGLAGTVGWPDSSSPARGDDRSSLLRVDNRGTCELCHGK